MSVARNASRLVLALVASIRLGALAVADEPEERYRIATYNVRNYLSMDRRVDGRFRRDYPKPESEKTLIRDSIARVDPDFLALEEMGAKAHLQELQEDLRRDGAAYENLAWLESGDQQRHVAALWNFDGKSKTVLHDDLWVNYFGERQKVKRGALEIILGEGEKALSIFIVHLKSKYTDRKDDPLSKKRRTLEARAIRDRIIERFPDPKIGSFLVVGDINDSPNSSPLRAFLKKGKRPISKILKCQDVNGEIWTHFYKRESLYSQIDYILISTSIDPQSFAESGILFRPDFYIGSDHRVVWCSVSNSFFDN